MDDNDTRSYNARANDMNRIAAANTDFMDDLPDTDGPADPAATDGSSEEALYDEGWFPPDSDTYEDELDTDRPDPFMNEAGDDPTKELQVSPTEYGDELDKLTLHDREADDDDDMRERIEDLDEADEDSAAAP